MLLANDRVRWPAFWTVAATLLLVQHLRFFFLSSDLPSASRYILAETTQGENKNLFIYLFQLRTEYNNFSVFRLGVILC